VLANPNPNPTCAVKPRRCVSSGESRLGVLKLSRADIPWSTTKDITAPVSSPAVMGSRSVSRCKKVYIKSASRDCSGRGTSPATRSDCEKAPVPAIRSSSARLSRTASQAGPHFLAALGILGLPLVQLHRHQLHWGLPPSYTFLAPTEAVGLLVLPVVSPVRFKFASMIAIKYRVAFCELPLAPASPTLSGETYRVGLFIQARRV